MPSKVVPKLRPLPVSSSPQWKTRPYNWQVVIFFINVIKVDLGICGGFTEVRKIAAMAGEQHIWFAPYGRHTLGAIAVAAVPNGTIVGSHPTAKLHPENPTDSAHLEVRLLEEPNTIDKDYVILSQKPGLGHQPNEDVVKKYEVKG